ncbi:MAG: 16S rRNA (cytosine(1402)-N(4))-methyltransferase RsmH [Hornefia sp.]|nr:16S rRNA (cytosine(1402)-N(4))-methyltransferase RsmH [Hornefia sp.]
MDFKHVPVLLKECIEGLNIKPYGIYVDGTLGGAGHSSYICRNLSEEGTLIGIDRDMDALAAAEERLDKYGCNKHFVHSNYSEIKSVLKGLGYEKVDGVLLDIGVSSFQLDNPNRGFSYMQDAPLDMRMDIGEGITAFQVVNTYSRKELQNIISKYGEERWASRIAEFIVNEREKKEISSTFELVDIIKKAIPAKARRSGPHPAKRTFQAIRIEVNDELIQLQRAINEYFDVLAAGGRFCVITFHSLEDRIVKDSFQKRANPCVCPPEFPVCVCGKTADIKKITRKPITAGEEELEKNPRSRSAKLRICEKI